MRLIDILKPECVKVPLEAADKQQAIYSLVDLLCDHTGIAARQDLKDAVWQREVTRTTGIGHGVAIPHGKCAGFDSLSMAVGKPAVPLDFGSIDGRPVDLIILLASPLDQTGPHIEALALISRILNDTAFKAALKKAASSEEVYELFAQHDSQFAK